MQELKFGRLKSRSLIKSVFQYSRTYTSSLNYCSRHPGLAIIISIASRILVVICLPFPFFRINYAELYKTKNLITKNCYFDNIYFHFLGYRALLWLLDTIDLRLCLLLFLLSPLRQFPLASLPFHSVYRPSISGPNLLLGFQ
jgi:hypothetical protein